MVNYKPAGYHAVTPYLTVQGVNKLIDFLKGAFNATEVKACHTTDDGTIMHAEVLIGDSWIMVGQASEQHLAKPTNLYTYVPNCDEVYQKAMSLGAKCEGPAGPRGEGFYAGYFRDADGNKLCAFVSG